MNYWLMKSEPDAFSIDDLEMMKSSPWDGVRNYQARNFMREMRTDDIIFFYHSSCKVPSIVGTAKVSKEAYPDHTSWDENSAYFDAKSTRDNPRWFMVDITFQAKWKTPLSLKEMKSDHALVGFKLLEKGNRLSILPLSREHAQHILMSQT
ncbi:EVE domain-containing protein [Marinomonas balearica]|uniref:Putative RNA-binding protein with PUA-like domain n=1 Tax=Marinomonas balearica TaxID=491947 RepID=A0A4R6MBB8_9GAMM|nr:EVE domain-containing protein [Marinomonas balearica]TDO98783.1 putative RNA-binding protein with PUA-like domain [Marinomonas balearica]